MDCGMVASEKFEKRGSFLGFDDPIGLNSLELFKRQPSMLFKPDLYEAQRSLMVPPGSHCLTQLDAQGGHGKHMATDPRFNEDTEDNYPPQYEESGHQPQKAHKRSGSDKKSKHLKIARKWTKAEVRALREIWPQFLLSDGRRDIKSITAAMQARGFERDSEQVKGKIRDLVKKYGTTVDIDEMTDENESNGSQQATNRASECMNPLCLSSNDPSRGSFHYSPPKSHGNQAIQQGYIQRNQDNRVTSTPRRSKSSSSDNHAKRKGEWSKEEVSALKEVWPLFLMADGRRDIKGMTAAMRARGFQRDAEQVKGKIRDLAKKEGVIRGHSPR